MKADFKKYKRVLAVAALAIIVAAGGACTPGGGDKNPAAGGGGDKEGQFAKALSSLNADWKLYEIGESRGAVTIKVEVQEIVSFQDGKKAMEAIQKVDPKFKGYIDFYDSKTGTVVRKMEVIPAGAGG